jgi:hypothetical protein
MRMGKLTFFLFMVIAVFAGNVVGQLSGPYDVGSGGDYADLPTAITALNSSGVSGHVQFLLTDASYTLTSALVINVSTSAPTSSATVTIKPATGVSPTITGSLGSTFLVQIIGTNYVTIDGSNSGGSSRDLTISNTSGSDPFVVRIGSSNPTPITNVTLKNCTIVNGSAVAANVAVLVSSATGGPTDGGYFSDITIQNNEISNTSNALIVNGRNPATGSNVNVFSNTIGGSAGEIQASGIKLLGVDGGTISGNSVSNFVETGGLIHTAIWLDLATRNVLVNANRIYDVHSSGTYTGMGISVVTNETNCGNVVRNNMIYDIQGPGADISGGPTAVIANPIGIYAGPPLGQSSGSQSGVGVYYNTVYLSGSALSGSGRSVGIAFDVGSSGTVKNNIIVNKLGGGGGALGMFASTSSGQFDAINHNDYYCASGSANNVGRIGGTDYASLGDFQTATSDDANSVSKDVQFVSGSDLRLAGTSVGDAALTGTPIPGITTDFEGDTRDATNPYMGLDEASIPLPITLAEFTAVVQPGTDYVRLYWATLSEINNFGFFIQRRQGREQSFTDVPGGFVVGHGTTSEPQQYTFTDTTVTSGTWYYRLKQVDLNGAVHLSEPVQVGVVTGVGELVPVEYGLSQNYPNPFNPSTVISYGLPNNSHVRLEVYDALGKLVETLVDKDLESGQYQVRLDGGGLAAGVYYYRMTAGDFVSTKKLLLVK